METDEICSEEVSDESKITPRLRAESVGIIETLEGIRRVGSEIFEICLGRPISRDSVFYCDRDRRFADIQEEMELIVVLR